MTATVIGLGGRLRAGKDEVADHLVREHGFVKIGMSDALHRAMMVLDPIIELEVPSAFSNGYPRVRRYSDIIKRRGYVEAKKVLEVRRLLQRLGTEVGRDIIGENVWVDITASTIASHLRGGRSVVVTGIRFSNELRMIFQFAGRAIWVERPDESAASGAARHASENGVTPEMFDQVLLNDGTLADLHRMASALAPRASL